MKRLRQSVRSLAAASAILLLGLAVYLFSLQPVTDALQLNLSEQFAFGQLISGFLALAIAGGLGIYAVDQVTLARAALADDRAARKDDHETALRSVLTPLFLELLFNRIVLLNQLSIPWYQATSPDARMWQFRTSAFDELSKSAFWRVAPKSGIAAEVMSAYTKLEGVVVETNPVVTPTFVTVGQSILIAVRQQLRPYYVLAMLIGVMSLAWRGRRSAQLNGRLRAALDAVEVAMEAIHPKLYG